MHRVSDPVPGAAPASTPAAPGGGAADGLALLLGAALASWAAFVWQSGGFSIDLPWGRLSSRDPQRPLLVAAIVLAIAVFRAGRSGMPPTGARALRMLEAIAPAAAALIAVLTGVLAAVLGAHVAEGSDAYGYLSQADLWAGGSLTIDMSALAPLPWQRPEWTLAPLGYRPGTDPYTIVPTYAPGLPMLMALAQRLFGATAKFAIVPICAALAVWLTYVLGARLYSRTAGALAAALLAASPTFLYQSMWPMSDVPAAAFWALAIVLAVAGRPRPAAAGIAAAVAILIRPNLVLLAAVPALLLLDATWSMGARERTRTLMRFAAGAAPGGAIVGLLNTWWYGSPLSSGYGSASALYSAQHLWPNAQRYPSWLIETQTVIVLLALLPLAAARLGPAGIYLRRPLVRAGCALLAIALCASYFFYLVFEEWWYLRFFLPLFPVLMVLTVAAMNDLLHRPYPAAGLLALPLVAALSGWTVDAARSRAVFDLRQEESSVETIARGVADATPANAAIFAMQHSGSLRYYADRLTLRYDLIRRDELDLAVRTLGGRGRSVFLFVEEWERARFVEKFSSYSCLGRLPWPARRQWTGVRAARLYELGNAPCLAVEGAAAGEAR